MSEKDFDKDFDQAIQRENQIRCGAFLELPDLIGTFPAAPLTLRHYTNLRFIGNPYVCGGTPTPQDAWRFLWHIHPCYGIKNHANKKALEKFCNRYFIPGLWDSQKKLAKKLERFAEVSKQIKAYIDEALQDRPGVRDGGDGVSYWSDAAGIIDTVACAYGWTREEIMNCPLNQTLQFVKIIHARRKAEQGQKVVLFNPSDRVKAEWLDWANRPENLNPPRRDLQ